MKYVISGYGKMGHMVEASLQKRGLESVATEDVCSVADELASESVCIDFTTPEAFRANYPVLAKKFKAVVVGTTGWNDIKEDVFAEFEKQGTTLVWASNFSIGVNAFFAAIARVSEVLAGHGYTPSVEEIHHIHKLDAPSGTAKSIGAIVEDKGFVSTSPDSSGGFSGSIEYVIRLPQGSQAMYVAPISKYQSERELLINCGGKYMVEDIEFDSYGDVRKIYMTLKNLQ